MPGMTREPYSRCEYLGSTHVPNLPPKSSVPKMEKMTKKSDETDMSEPIAGKERKSVVTVILRSSYLETRRSGRSARSARSGSICFESEVSEIIEMSTMAKSSRFQPSRMYGVMPGVLHQ